MAVLADICVYLWTWLHSAIKLLRTAFVRVHIHVCVFIQAMATNKSALNDALAVWEQTLQDKTYLAGSRISVADLVGMAELRTAFEKVFAANCKQ